MAGRKTDYKLVAEEIVEHLKRGTVVNKLDGSLFDDEIYKNEITLYIKLKLQTAFSNGKLSEI